MKPVFCRVVKAPPVGSDVRICYTGNRGGRTEASYIVKSTDYWRDAAAGEDLTGRETEVLQHEPGGPKKTTVKCTDEETRSNIATSLKNMIAGQWSSDMFGVMTRGNELVITSIHTDHRFYPMLNGTQAEGEKYITIEQ